MEAHAVIREEAEEVDQAAVSLFESISPSDLYKPPVALANRPVIHVRMLHASSGRASSRGFVTAGESASDSGGGSNHDG